MTCAYILSVFVSQCPANPMSSTAGLHDVCACMLACASYRGIEESEKEVFELEETDVNPIGERARTR